MNLSAVEASQDAPEGEQKRSLNSELWHACAGPLVCLPTARTRVVYFPQGHSEQVAATTNRELEGHIPNYPNLPPHLFCHLHNVTVHADAETDEVFAQMTLQPLSLQEQKETFFPIEMGAMSKQPTNYFCKTLTASDTSMHGGFSVPRRAAEKVFPPLDFSQQPPAQELIARDLHDVEWKFRHVYRGQPKRHLLTTGWSVFVSAKRLVAGDSVLFIWNENNQLLLGIRRANRQQKASSSSVLSSDSMHIGLLAAAAHAAAANSWFTVFYNPRASPSEFIIPLSKYVKAVFHTHVSVGMRFRMLFETEECIVRRYMGTITGISDFDPVGWPNSHWRSVKVGWDESTACERQLRVSLWEIEPLTTFPMYPFPLRLQHHWAHGVSCVHDTKEAELNDFLWLRNGAGGKGLPSCKFPSVATGPWVQQRLDSLLVGNELNQYQVMPAGAFEDIQGSDVTKQHFLQNQQSFQSPKHSMMISPFVHHQDVQQALQQQIISSEPQCLLEDQSNSVQHQQLQQGQNGNHRYNVQQARAYDDTSQNSNHVQQQPTLPFQYEKVVFPDSNLIFLSAAPSSSTHCIPGFAYLKGHTRPYNCSQLDQSIVCDQRQQTLDSNLTRAQVTPLNSGAMLPSFADKDNAVVNQNIPGAQNHMLELTMDATLSGAFSVSHVSSCAHTSLLDEPSDLLQNLGEIGPHSQTFVKVYKSGSVGRSLDISRFSNYDELRMELSHMFGIEGLLEDPLRSGWQLVFVDRENDVLLLGDDPWESFVNNVWYIKILSPEDVHNMGAGSGTHMFI